MRLFKGHLAIYYEKNARSFWKEFYISMNGGLKVCIGRFVVWYKHL